MIDNWIQIFRVVLFSRKYFFSKLDFARLQDLIQFPKKLWFQFVPITAPEEIWTWCEIPKKEFSLTQGFQYVFFARKSNV